MLKWSVVSWGFCLFVYKYKPSNLWFLFELYLFFPALSCNWQRSEEASLHPDSESTGSEKRSLSETEVAGKKEQPVEYYNTQMGSELLTSTQEFSSITQQMVQQIEGEYSAYASAVLIRVQDNRRRFT